eukprot:1194873-Prorocentrum_minimum.AAC.6
MRTQFTSTCTSTSTQSATFATHFVTGDAVSLPRASPVWLSASEVDPKVVVADDKPAASLSSCSL